MIAKILLNLNLIQNATHKYTAVVHLQLQLHRYPQNCEWMLTCGS